MTDRHRRLHHSPVGHHLESGQLSGGGVYRLCFTPRVGVSGYTALLPEPWWRADYATRRATCQVPQALTLQTKPQLAVEMLRLLDGEDVLPCTYVVPDCL